MKEKVILIFSIPENLGGDYVSGPKKNSIHRVSICGYKILPICYTCIRVSNFIHWVIRTC
jgi:hypothetical protein